jgi:hypothetical protein
VQRGGRRAGALLAQLKTEAPGEWPFLSVGTVGGPTNEVPGPLLRRHGRQGRDGARRRPEHAMGPFWVDLEREGCYRGAATGTCSYDSFMPAEESVTKDDNEIGSKEDQGALWSREDTRLLLITFGATLAANIATVMVVGLALVVAHGSKHTSTRSLVEWTIECAVCLPVFTVAFILRKAFGDSRLLSGFITILTAFVLITLILIWIGRAAQIS